MNTTFQPTTVVHAVSNLVRDVAADGWRNVVVLELGLDCGCEGTPVKPDLDEWQQLVFDSIRAYGLRPSIELREENYSNNGYLYSSPLRIWELVARW